MSKMTMKNAISAIDQAGILLVFPIKNQTEPASLWSAFFPRSKMRWEWDDEGDSRVADLWHLRTELSDCRDVVYAKWFRGRATFFSKAVFPAVLRQLGTVADGQKPVGPEARRILEALYEDSPLSPRVLREITDLQGKFCEPAFNRAIKELWVRLQVVGFGEIDDGAFPSLAVGATKLLFEELWDEAQAMTAAQAAQILNAKLSDGNLFRKFLERAVKQLSLSSLAKSAKLPPARWQEPFI